MKKKILLTCLILCLGTALFLSFRLANQFLEPEEQQGIGIVSMRDGKQVLTIQAGRDSTKNSSNTIYLFTCDRFSNKIYCRFNADIIYGELNLYWYSKGVKLLSMGYLGYFEAYNLRNQSYSFGTPAGVFKPGDQISIRVKENSISGNYKLEVSQEEIL